MLDAFDFFLVVLRGGASPHTEREPLMDPGCNRHPLNLRGTIVGMANRIDRSRREVLMIR